MNVVDSSGWLEYFADGPHASFFSPAIEDTARLIVPTISLLEVFKKILQERDEPSALAGIALMQQGKLVDLTAPIAISAGKLGKQYRLPLADSVILATAQSFEAVIWTQDSDFKGLPGVRYQARKKK